MGEDDGRVQAEVSALRGRLLDACRPLMGRYREAALIGFPNHGNVGDSAIWLGQLRLLEEFGLYPPEYTASADSYSAGELRRHTSPDTLIVLSGGGNLGDLWPTEQRLREAVVEQFPDRSILQLPQSVWFEDANARSRAKRILGDHPDFTLFVRDRDSQTRARKGLSLDPQLAPDAAFALGPLAGGTPREPRIDVLCLLRMDKEAERSTGEREISDSCRFTAKMKNVVVERSDWRRDEKDLAGRLLRQIHPHLAAWTDPWKRRVERELALRRLRYGLGLLQAARLVISDRLHGHILSVLAGVPHALVDNSYGKISSYYQTWTQNVENARFHCDMEEAMDWALAEAVDD